MLLDAERFQMMEKQMLENHATRDGMEPVVPRKIESRMMVTEGPVPDQILASAPNPDDIHLFQASFDFSNLVVNCVIDYKEQKMMNHIWPTFQDNDTTAAVDTSYINLFIRILNQTIHDFGSVPNTLFIWLDNAGSATMAMPNDQPAA